MSNQINRAPLPTPKARFGHKPKKAAAEAPPADELPYDEHVQPTGEEDDEATISHLLPKVMVPYKTRPGETPRKVEIQRKRRLYEQQDLNALIKDRGLEGVPPPSLFALDVFDNTDHESRLPTEWVPKAEGVPPALAFTAVFQDDGSCEWAQCKVIDHDAATNHYCIIVLPEGGGEWPDASQEKPVWVPRVALYFAAEDPFRFASRYAEAHTSRARAEALLRYSLYVDSMPTEDMPTLSTEQINRMLGYALNSKQLKDKLMDSSQLVSEVNLEYARTMNKIIFDETLRRGTSGCAGQIVSVGEEFAKDPARAVPDKGTVNIGEDFDYPHQFSEFAFRTLLTKSEVIGALSRIKLECSKVLKMSMMMTTYPKSARLDEFETSQVQNIDQVSNYLRDSWSATLKNSVKSAFKDVGKGWFNLHETNMETFEFSKLKKFLMQMRFIMEDTLRFMIEASLQRFVQFIQSSCPTRISVNSTASVDVEMPPATVESGVSTGGRRPPLLLLELQMNKESTKFCYSTPTELIAEKIPIIFDLAISKVQGLPQLDAAIMENLFWATVPPLNSVHPNEEPVVKLREQLKSMLAVAMVPLETYLTQYKKYEDLLQLNVEAYVAALEAKGEDLTLAEMKAEVKKHTAELEALVEALPSGISIGIAHVSVLKTREVLVKKKEKLVNLLVALCSKVPKRMMQALTAKFQEIDKALRVKTGNLEEVDETRKYIDSLPNKIGELMAEIEAAKPWYDTLEGFNALLSEEDARDKFVGESWPTKLTRLAERQMDVLQGDEERYKDEMHEEQDSFTGSISDLQNLTNTVGGYFDTAKMDSIVTEVKSLNERLKAAEKEAGMYNSREALLGEPVTDYSMIKKTMDQFDPFLQFWTTASDWKTNHHNWINNSWEELSGEMVEKEVAAAYKTLWKCGKAFNLRALDKIAENCETTRSEVEGFKKFVPLIQALRNPGMAERHWNQLSEQLGFPLHPDKNFTMAKAEEMGLLNHLDVIVKVCDAAGKEHSIEKALDKMSKEWESTEMQVLDYRETKTFIIKVEEQISQMLDDHIVMTQSMTFSPFKKPFEERILKWEQQLNLVSEILEQWIAVQRQWMYLEPIFSSQDIMQQLPLEGKRFATVDRMWRKTTEIAHRNPQILKVCNSQKLLDQFIEANKLLESVQKGLSDYLETKRLAFARFFFLSNDELLQILSQTKNPLSVQPHLRKCFEAIESLDFADNLEISGMNSKEKEKCPFDKPMFPTGSVEIWLGEVERRMKASVRCQVVESLANYVQVPRNEWVKNWPAMVVLAVSGIFWSTECEQAIIGGKVEDYLKKCSQDLLDLTDLVRGQLSNQDRTTLGALITVDVHSRDTVQELVDCKIERPSDFEWVSRLRYYWRDDVYVDMVQASINYGYEYIGNTPRLVITPLTDRCYMTLMSAMHLNLGGAPAGPAGTGKTETTKDLAKALAKQCVVFNCSDGLDYLAMGKFFKGLASSGAWACFDEFNRIDLEVLSVVAQQILTIQLAIMAKVKRFIFEDTEIDLNFSCTVYITMNPGYAGRSELPDNLKALFRPCAMMVPDYALIAEICLYSYGYRYGKELSKKMVATFKLCSEQLSSQDHYDYGMRAVKSVITAAGNLKREFPKESEDVLLLRSLRDVNYPKFLSHDLPLFNGIISDLFPGVTPPEVDYKNFMEALTDACHSQGIQPVATYLEKVIQLYETTIVRHGLMLVGPTMGGKTCCYRSLQKTMTQLAGNGDPKYEKVRIVALNPKSITMGQLYGEFDENTHEWSDGVLACYMRECSEDPKPDKKWIMFDGPVDAVWIENMNTVLDDNKKLCLVSGEIIQLSEQMTMMFEVEDLAVASPATVSRCGMVYMEPTALGVEPLLTSWLQRLPPGVIENQAVLQEIFMALVPESLRFVRRNLKETVATVAHNLVMSCFNLVDSLVRPYIRTEGMSDLTAEEKGSIKLMLPSLMVFSIVWSVGASCDKAGRVLFDQFIRNQVNGTGEDCDGTHLACLPEASMFPLENTVYDWCYDQEKSEWVPWMTTIPDFRCDPDQPFSSIIVPTADTVRYTYLIDRLVACNKHVLCVGDTGTGKTLNVVNKLMYEMPPEVIPVFMTFSARTSANQTMDIIDAKMDKRRKGVFGPPSGKKYVIFVDDLNMPMREKYFAQPPIELLRQWMDHGGWYERKAPCAYRNIVDTQFVGSMGPPGGGRNPVTNRLLRHFNFISFTGMSDESVSRIFSTILGSFLKKYFNESIQGLSEEVVASTVELYNSIREELLPTPSKSHYTFNLRDLSMVIQGVMRADAKTTSAPNQILSLWLHECVRVFEDRLTTEDDHTWFRNAQNKLLGSHFHTDYETVVPCERLIFGDFMIPGADPKIFTQITDMPKLVKVVEEYLEDYNSVSNAPMKLVMFLDAIEHVSRVTRVIRLPLGNALLLGVGGSGRQSLTRLAAFMEEYDTFQIEIAKGYDNNAWREDLKKVLKKAGMDGKDTVFIFTDSQIVQESFLEDINNILNAGEVPNLFANDDIEAIGAAMRPLMTADGLQVTKVGIYSYFINRVRNYLHLVLCFSPIGDAFRQRLRMFPSLVNCCTIDWFREWPNEALKSVAYNFYADVEIESDTNPELLKGVVECCVFIHQAVEKKSKVYYDELRRYNYVTPTSYLELLTTFIKLLGEKRLEIVETKRRLEVGLQKLLSTAGQVAKMQEELQDLQPVLAKTATEVEDMMVVITHDKSEADQTKQSVEIQEKEANEQAASAKEIADDAQRDLDEALPALDAAVASLKNLSRNDVVEVKAMQNPPSGVKLVMEAACIMFEEKPKMVDDPNRMGKKIPNYWIEASKKILNDPSKFLDSLLTFDKDNISEKVIKTVEPYIQMEEFTPEAVAKVSKACTSICMWVRAMYIYHNVALQVAPKRAALKGAQDLLAETMGKLAEAQSKLRAVEEKIGALEKSYGDAVTKKEALAQQVADCTVKLERADKLIGGLGGERVRWQETVAQLGKDMINVVGDVVVAAGSIAYSGPFTPVYRQQLTLEWVEHLQSYGVPSSEHTSLIKTLQDPVKIRMWTIAGLPTDNVSVENGIIVSKARRWPLMIDPQGQANKWIKNMEKESGLDVIKLSDKDFLRTLENGVRFGRAVLLENIAESLDAALEPLLLKQTFKQGGSEVIKIGDNIIPYHPDFRFYMTTKMRNPHYAPEVSVKVSLLNFFVTSEGLEEQLLGTVVTQERPDLANLKGQLVVSNAQMKKELKEIEDKILFMLSNSTGNILDDEELINTLSQSKVTSNEIQSKVAEAEVTEKQIDETRELYRPVAIRASLLFFCISDLALVDPMYQYSLAWFVNLFIKAIDEAPKSQDVAERGINLNEYFTYSLYVNICRSLFESHKLMFSLLLTVKVLQNLDMINGQEWRFLLAGPTSSEVTKENPAHPWLTDKSWIEVLNLAHLPEYEGFDHHFAENTAHYKGIFDSNDAHEMPLADPWQGKLSSFQKLLVLRCLRPDKVTMAIQNFVTEHMGQRFIEPPPFDLATCFKESAPATPLIFVLSSGADPMADLLKLADEMKFTKKFEKVSLGQGQGPKAEKLLEAGMDRGIWVCLQNCHLAVSWMPTLDRIVENIEPDKVHKDFRLWLTSMPSPNFPVSILQNGVKMTLEPPKGLKSNLFRQYNRLTDVYLNQSSKPESWRRLLFGLCLFHAVIQDRRKFGPLGWNIRYEFTDGDLNVSLAQMQEYLDKYDEIPYRVLRFLFTEINYGGRVTDDKDRRLINNLVNNFCNNEVEKSGYNFSPSGTYTSAPCDTIKEYLEHIRVYPIVPKPEIFGLHENADITCDMNETYGMFEIVLSLQPRVAASGGQSQEEVIMGLAVDILAKVPKEYDLEAVQKAYPTVYNQSMNTVLTQECIRYNNLLSTIARTLKETVKALKGLVVMSPELEAVAFSMYDNQVPDMWAAKAYPSLKPLSSWVGDLIERCKFVQKWIDTGIPVVYWISGFFFPQAFLTGTLQNFARKNGYAIDTVSFSFQYMDHLTEDVAEGPIDGCYIRGMFMEGARWDLETHQVGESRPKELFTDCPIVWLKPEQHRKKPTDGFYDCPVYKTLTRAGTLSTTGHSTNFVMYLELPSDKEQSHWINRGLALFTDLAF